jgi:rhodanese-related sulfurtransferase
MTTTTGKGLVEIDATTLNAWLEAGEAVLVDVREPAEHAGEHIAGAQLLPLSRFDAAPR